MLFAILLPEFGIGGSFFLKKMKGCIPSGGYCLNAAVYSGQAEDKRAFQVGRHRPV